MKKTILLLICAGALAHTVFAQDCAGFRRSGEEMMNKKDYPQALSRFWAAMIACEEGNTDIIELIKETQNRWVRDLESAVQREKKAYQEAVVAKEAAEKARAAEEAVRRDLEVKERLAKERGQRAETLRISLLADIVRERGNKRDALLLSWLAMRLSGTDIAPLTYGSFGKAVCDSFTQTIYTSPAIIERVQYFDNGKRLFVKNSDGTLSILTPGKAGTSIALPEKESSGTALSAASPWLLTWRTDNRVRLWHSDGSPGPTLEGHTEAVRQAAFSHDGTKVVTASRDNTARIWNTNGQLLATLTGHTGNVYEARFSADDQYICTRSADGTVRIWKADGTSAGHLKPADIYFYHAFWLETGHTLAVRAADGSLRLWSPETDNLIPIQAADVAEVALSSGASLLSVMGKNGQLRMFNAQGTQTLLFPETARGFALHPGGKGVLLWNAESGITRRDGTGQLLYQLPARREHLLNAALHAQRDCFLANTQDGKGQEAQCTLNDSKGAVLARWPLGTVSPLSNQFSPDGQSVLLVLQGGKTLAIAPFPEDIYEKTEMTDQEREHLIKTYNIELFDALVK